MKTKWTVPALLMACAVATACETEGSSEDSAPPRVALAPLEVDGPVWIAGPLSVAPVGFPQWYRAELPRDRSPIDEAPDEWPPIGVFAHRICVGIDHTRDLWRRYAMLPEPSPWLGDVVAPCGAVFCDWLGAHLALADDPAPLLAEAHAACRRRAPESVPGEPALVGGRVAEWSDLDGAGLAPELVLASLAEVAGLRPAAFRAVAPRGRPAVAQRGALALHAWVGRRRYRVLAPLGAAQVRAHAFGLINAILQATGSSRRVAALDADDGLYAVAGEPAELRALEATRWSLPPGAAPVVRLPGDSAADTGL